MWGGPPADQGKPVGQQENINAQKWRGGKSPPPERDVLCTSIDNIKETLHGQEEEGAITELAREAGKREEGDGAIAAWARWSGSEEEG